MCSDLAAVVKFFLQFTLVVVLIPWSLIMCIIKVGTRCLNNVEKYLVDVGDNEGAS